MLSVKVNLEINEYFNFLEELKEKLDSNEETSKDAEIYFMALNKEIPVKWKKYLNAFKEKQDELHQDDFVEFLKNEKCDA